ncbi:mitotic-spindle organizing protein 2A [Trichonephila clavipes]|nr:mitotic-spindle organizing protein 2A [Trichonephila clavipes]
MSNWILSSRNIGRYSLHPIFSNSLAIKKPLSAITTSFGSKRSISLLLIKTSLSDLLPVNNSDMKLIAPLGVMPIIPLKGKKETLEWCMKANLIASRYECSRCKKNMRLQKRKGTVDGYEWRCRNQSKDNRHDVVRSVRKGTWFSESKLAITIILRLTRYWFGKSMNEFVMNDLKVNKNMRQS